MFKYNDSLRETRDYARKNANYTCQWNNPRNYDNNKSSKDNDKKEK